jgi:ABC-2 type transport system ATP-binding protein
VSAALRVEGLAKHFGRLRALEGVGFEAAPGEAVAVLGPNGAGKTTLLSILAGAQRADAGSVSRSPREIGWAPQQAALYSRLTVAENLELFARLERVADVPGTVAAMLRQTGLQDRAGELAQHLSGGNRQRVNVAIALTGDPPVLALDEPSAALDPAQRERLWGFLDALTGEGRTIVFSTHSPAEAERHAQRLLVLADGRLVYDGTAAQLRERAGTPAGDLEEALVRFLSDAAEAPR